MLDAVISIARFTLLEAVRTRLLLAAVVVVASFALLAEFSAALAITESQSYRTGVYAALSRLGMVVMVMLFVVTSVMRELESGLLDRSWSAPLSRGAWYAGRLAGFVLVATFLAVLATAPPVFSATPARAGLWGTSLAAELALVAAISLTATTSLRQVTAAVMASGAFYLLARTIDAMVLMSHGPLVDVASSGSQVLAAGVAAVALVLPALDRYTQSAWLFTDAPVALAPLLLQALVYIFLVATIGLCDLYRHEN